MVGVETGVLALGAQRSTSYPLLLASDPRILMEQWPSQLLPQLGGQAEGPPLDSNSLLQPCCQPLQPLHLTLPVA